MGESLGCVEGYVFVDAGLPHPGRSWFDSAPPELAEQLLDMAIGGWAAPVVAVVGAPAASMSSFPTPTSGSTLPPDAPPLPVAMFEEVHPQTPGWPDAPCGYLRLSEPYQEPAARARALGWPVIELASHHLAVLTEAAAVVEPLLELVDQLER